MHLIEPFEFLLTTKLLPTREKNQYISLNVQIFFKAILENKKNLIQLCKKKSMRTAKQKGKSEKMGSELEGSHFFPKLNIFLRSLKQLKNIGENGVEKKNEKTTT